MYLWDLRRSRSYGLLFNRDCLLKDVSRGSSDLVIYFARAGTRKRGAFLGKSLFDYGYVWVKQPAWAHVKNGYQKAFHILLHELAHAFGAVHLYCDDDDRSPALMCPMVSEWLIRQKGMERVYDPSPLHPGNARIMRVMRNRSFRPGEWTDSLWPQIRAAYDSLRIEWNRWSIDDSVLSGHEKNVFLEDDPFFYLATWASLSGRDSLALLYADSMRQVSEALPTACTDAGANCFRRQCRRIGCTPRLQQSYLRQMQRDYHRLRMMIYLRAAAFESADAEFERLLACYRDKSDTFREWLRQSYIFHRGRIPLNGKES
jgi:hypothetical protein